MSRLGTIRINQFDKIQLNTDNLYQKIIIIKVSAYIILISSDALPKIGNLDDSRAEASPAVCEVV